jgi:hypothetical protein
MEMVIFYKAEKGKPPQNRYKIELQEFQRLSADYANYLNTGFPKEGVYKVQVVKDQPESATIKMTRFKFEKIAAIV